MLTLTAVIQSIRFRNEENGYTVATIESDGEDITAVGILQDPKIGDTYEITGEHTFHKKYGEQIQISYAVKVRPTTAQAILKYLSSGIIPHIGARTAKLIIDAFGEETLEVMENQPERLLEIRGIGKKKLKTIISKMQSEKESRETIVFLQTLGVSPAFGMRIFKKYGPETKVRILENPYQLIDDVAGIGFQLADRIAQRNDIKKDSAFRIEAGIRYLLTQEATVQGNCYLQKEIFIAKAQELLALPRECIEGQLQMLVVQNTLRLQDLPGEGVVVYHEPLYLAEVNVASKLIRLVSDGDRDLGVDPAKTLEDLDGFEGIDFAEAQMVAIEKAMTHNVLVITGGPGTGKTTIIRAIVALYESLNKTFSLAAPTGRAAKRMEESTGHPAQTIHRLLGYRQDEASGRMVFDRGDQDPLDCDLLIVDEASMIDIYLCATLMNALTTSTRLVIVGDIDQLPSVGPGNVLKDLIDSSLIEVVRLTEIFRQGKDSNIVINAHRINKGLGPIVNAADQDFFFIAEKDPYKTRETLLELVSKRLPAFYGLDPKADIQVLTASKKGEIGVFELNRALQDRLNPKVLGTSEVEMGEVVFRTGDRIMQVVNNYQITYHDHNGEEGTGIYNGDLGWIERVDEDTGELTVRFDDDRRIRYETNLSELTHSYAMTIHKSQGSEFTCVVIPLLAGNWLLQNRNLLYTGITRAKKLVVIVGDEHALRQMIANNRMGRRNSSLSYQLKKSAALFEKVGGYEF